MMKRMNQNFLLMIAVLSSVLMVCPASALKREDMKSYHTSNGRIDFYAIGRPSFLKVHGIANSMEGVINSNAEISGHFSIKLSDFKTGVGLRDKDLRNKVFVLDQYPPTAELTLNPIPLKLREKTDFSALLKMHGVEKEVQGQATVKFNGDKAIFEATFNILLTDFNMKPPEFAGLKIQNDVRVEVSGEASI